MKYLLVVVCMLGASSALEKEILNQLVDEIRRVGEICIVETKATADDVRNILAHTIPESQEGKCLIFCFHKYFKLQNDDGSINGVESITALNAIKENDPILYEKIVKIYKTCSAVDKNTDLCVYAANIAQCAVGEAKNLGLDELIILE